MTRPHAFVIKYMPDLRRREPINIGVVVTDGESLLSRFIGEDDAGQLKGLNSVPRIFESRKTYRSWWKHWQRVIAAGDADPEVLQRKLVPDVASNYMSELAMVEIAGGTVALPQFLEEAWAALVSGPTETADESDEDFVEVTDRLIEPYRHRHGFHVWKDTPFGVFHEDKNGRPFEATLHFHYMIQNGRWSHLRRLKLSGPDTNTWNAVHLTVRQFEGLVESPDPDHRQSAKIALVQTKADNPEAERQMQEIERKEFVVVQVDDEDFARQMLAETIG